MPHAMFRFFVILISMFSLAPASLAQLVSPHAIDIPNWFTETFLDFREDVRDATKENKRLLVYFGQDGCPYCTAAFCTILNYGLGSAEDYVSTLAEQGLDAVTTPRLRTLLEFALRVNADARSITDADVDGLRAVGLSDKGIVQLIHLVSDFASYNRLNLAVATDYDYRDMWRTLAFNWQPNSGEPAGDNTRGVPLDV